MARTISIIKSSITTNFMANETLATLYGFTVGDSFDTVFSKVSFESILFYIIATAIWTLETLFDAHTTEVTEILAKEKRHSAEWYANKVLDFMYGYELVADTDEYDTSGLSDSQITAAKIVKYSKGVEYQGRLFIKVAGEGLTQLTTIQQTALQAYIDEFLDAGVQIGPIAGKTTVTNLKADHFGCSMTVYYNPMILDADGKRLDTGDDIVRDTIKTYVKTGIGFNGEYRNINLTNELQTIDGVIIPELQSAKTVTDADYTAAVVANTTIPWVTVSAKCVPASGYLNVYDDADLDITFVAYQTIES